MPVSERAAPEAGLCGSSGKTRSTRGTHSDMLVANYFFFLGAAFFFAFLVAFFIE